MVDHVVVDASPIILLSRVGRLPLLRAVARVVSIPYPVVEEVNAKGAADPAAQGLAAASWARRVDAVEVPTSIAAWNLGTGESAVLAFARSMPGAHVVLDDREARRCAATLGLSAFGTIGVVLRGKKLGAIPAARPVLEELVSVGMYVRRGVLDAAAALVGE
jgi:predicted nucleic acid-binding protein